MQKNKYYSEISVKAVNDKHPVLRSRKRTFLFRGQKDAEWELETSLDRFLKQIHKSDKKKVEPYLIEEFQRRYRNYANNVPNRNNKIELPLALWKPINENILPNTPASLTDKEIELLENTLATPDGKELMKFVEKKFVSNDGRIAYPVRGKRVYFEIAV